MTTSAREVRWAETSRPTLRSPLLSTKFGSTPDARQAGIKQIDYVLITHFHRDHVGGVPQLVDGIKVGTFVDHGPNMEDSEVTRADYAAYEKAIAGHAHVVVKPGYQDIAGGGNSEIQEVSATPEVTKDRKARKKYILFGKKS